MFNIFKKQSELEQLQKKYQQLMHSAFQLSKTDRKESDRKTAEAHEVLLKIEKIESKDA
jgi:hypothetical protein